MAGIRELTLEEIEDRRQLEHVVPLFVAFLLPYITWRGVLVLGLLGLVYSLYVSPCWIQVTTRPEERNRISIAKLSYTLASLSVLLCFHRQMYIGAGAFAVLAVGDALSNLVGRKVGGPRFPYNRRKTVAGFIAFSLGGTLAAWVVILWNSPTESGYPATTLLLFCALVAVACALVETVPAPIDDNITIVWVAAALFWLLFQTEPNGSANRLIGWIGLLHSSGVRSILVLQNQGEFRSELWGRIDSDRASGLELTQVVEGLSADSSRQIPR